jgi:3',5'-nucleoside bisphosphate phosphatase
MSEWYRADLHIHTVLSACAELSMGPRDIVLAAEEKHLDVIAVTDHNSMANVWAVMQAAIGHDLVVIPGMEVATSEDVHVICLFPEWEKALRFQDFIYQHLLEGHYDESLYGPQIVLDENENIIDKEDKLLAFSTTVTMIEVYQEATKLGGIAYPAHIDRQAYSALSTLGHIPEEIPFDAVEISHRLLAEEARAKFPELARYQLITASDAHDIADIGKAVTSFFLEKPTFAEIKAALADHEHQRVSIARPEVQVQRLAF